MSLKHFSSVVFMIVSFLLAFNSLHAASNDDITKSKGIDQSIITSLNPSPEQKNVSPDSLIEAVFEDELDKKSVKGNSVKLRCLTCNKKGDLKGSVSYDKY